MFIAKGLKRDIGFLDNMTPLDRLNYLKGKEVTVELKDGEEVTGILKAFDLNINLSVEILGKMRFINGFDVLFIKSQE